MLCSFRQVRRGRKEFEQVGASVCIGFEGRQVFSSLLPNPSRFSKNKSRLIEQLLFC